MSFKKLTSLLAGTSALALLISVLACGGSTEPQDGNNPSGDELPARSRGQLCGSPGGSGCYPSETCEQHTDGRSYCFCPVGTVPGSGSRCVDPNASNNTEAAKICSQLGDDHCAGKGVCVDVKEEACDYHAERNISEPEICATVRSSGRPGGACVSSLSDPTTTPYEDGAGLCDFTQFWSNPSALKVDCRCAQPFEVSECKRPYSLDATIRFGEGPRFRDLDQVDQLGGFQEGREFIIATAWKSAQHPRAGALFAVNLDTGARRVVSGGYVSPTDGYTLVGEGPEFGLVTHTIKGADGSYYVSGTDNAESGAPPVIFRVDPSTGDRTIVFDANDPESYALCPNGAPVENPGTKIVQLQGGNRWTMDPEGNHYFSAIGAAPGPSIVRVSPDGQSCEYVTRLADGPVTFDPPNVGEGYDAIQFDFENLYVHDGKLYARSDKLLIEVNLADGRRKLVSDAKTGSVGDGPYGANKGLGEGWTTWDPHHNVLWMWGAPSDANLLFAIDLTNGDRISSPCWHPTLGRTAGCDGNGAKVGGYIGMGAMIVDEQAPHDLYFAFDNEAVIRMEQSTGNVNIISR